MSSVVLDTSALLAILFGESGAETATARGHAGMISAVSYSEAMAKSLDRQAPLETVKHSLDSLRLTVVPFDSFHAATAASYRPATRHLDYSFADRACIATAALAKLPVLTGDRKWSKIDLGVEIVLIR